MAAARAAYQAWNQKNVVPIHDLGQWDEYLARLFRYQFYDSYYNNIAYSTLNSYVARYKFEKKLYKNIRSIYNPVERLVDLIVAKTYGGALDMENLTSGAIPLVGASPEMIDAIRQLWIWSNWATKKSLFVQYGAKYADTILKIVDEPEREKVRMEVLHPGKIKEATRDSVGNVKAVTIEYECDEPTIEGRWGQPPRTFARKYVYTEKIDQEQFRFFKDGKPFDYVNNVEGGEFAEYDNEYGFVPLVIGGHKDLGLLWSANAFHAQVEKIDELNDSASLLNDEVRKHVKVLWYFAGVKQKSELKTASAELEDEDGARRDTIDAIYGPEGSQPYAMVSNLNIESALNNIQKMLDELERDLPQLALHRLREQGQATAPGVRATYSDASDLLAESAGNYNDTLVRAQQMAVSIGGFRKYRGFEPFDLDSYAAGELEHFIKIRPIIGDELSLKEEMDVLRDFQVPAWVMLEKLDYDQKTIDRVLADKEVEVRNAARGLADSVFGVAEEEEAEEEAQPPVMPAPQPEMMLAGV